MTLNTPHKVTLTEGEISVILNNLEEKYGHLLDGEIPEEVQTIFSKLEGSVDASVSYTHLTLPTVLLV